MSGRDLTWDMAFLPDGTMFFTEKCRGLSVRLPSGTINALLGIKDSKGYPDTASDLFCSGQAGMAGVAIDPDFATNRYHLRVLDVEHDRARNQSGAAADGQSGSDQGLEPAGYRHRHRLQAGAQQPSLRRCWRA